MIWKRPAGMLLFWSPSTRLKLMGDREIPCIVRPRRSIGERSFPPADRIHANIGRVARQQRLDRRPECQACSQVADHHQTTDPKQEHDSSHRQILLAPDYSSILAAVGTGFAVQCRYTARSPMSCHHHPPQPTAGTPSGGTRRRPGWRISSPLDTGSSSGARRCV